MALPKRKIQSPLANRSRDIACFVVYLSEYHKDYLHANELMDRQDCYHEIYRWHSKRFQYFITIRCSEKKGKEEQEGTRTKHSSDSLPVHQTFTCSVFVYSLLSGTAMGNVSPKVGLRRSTTGFVQHM